MRRFLFLLFVAILTMPALSAQASFATHLRVGLTERFSGRASISINNREISVDGGQLYSANGFVVRPYGYGQLAFYDGGQRVGLFNSPALASAAGTFWLEGIEYRGSMEFVRVGGGISAVNIVSLEEYLFSVVPSEMPASWHIEALKAQAVAARTYALYNMAQAGRHTLFDLCDQICCQVYRGVYWEHENSTQAVLATAGLTLRQGGALIDAVYFASSGGMTENSENVWLEARPYLRSVADPHEYEPVTWTRTFHLSDINSLLARGNHAIGQATGISITEVLPSGRVATLLIQGSSGQLSLQGEEIRTFFSATAEGSLESRNFTIAGNTTTQEQEVTIFDGHQVLTRPLQGLHILNPDNTITIITTSPTTTTTTTTNTITLTGQGAGHGVGLSQRGAKGMAQNNQTFREILLHFFTDVTID